MRWWEDRFVLAMSATLAIHLLVAVIADAIVVTHPARYDDDPPRVELIDIKYDPPPPPKAAPLPEPEQPKVEPEPAPAVARERVAQPHAPPRSETPPPPIEPPPSAPASPDPGGAPVLKIDDLAPAATGVEVAKGPRTHGAVGRGGTGAGTGSGNGGGAGDRPLSVAMIKTRAMPRGDFSYYDLGREYPSEAKQLGIEGDIRVRLVVDEHGKVASATLLPPGLGHGLDALALSRARQIQFTPAVDSDDRPVSSVVVWTFHMTLPK
ncbi:MAG: energy transducer TonB [Acidobacteriota bacterium]